MRNFVQAAGGFASSIVVTAVLAGAPLTGAQAQTACYGTPGNCKSIGPSATTPATINSSIQDSVVGGGVSGFLDEFPAGRLRETWHDGLRIEGGGTTGSFRETEASAFGSTSISVPQDFAPGDLKLGVFTGYSKLNADFSNSAKAAVDARFIGGYGLYSIGSTYAMFALTGLIADVDLTYGTHSSYDMFGGAGNLSVGHVFDLGNARELGNLPVKLDLKGGLIYNSIGGNTFSDAGTRLSSGLIGWNGVFSATLFSEIKESSGSLLRPYVKAELREQLRYDNFVDTPFTTVHFTQDDTLGFGEVGFEYILPGYSLSASVYGEAAQDRATIGGKLGAKFKLD